ncbi:hypothetical protein O1611_g10031 [Lasiodiplodia mahajangana]|uniref:Uncharacterized protein n=1 Tax=Lasiodiplodia mahajangana TaxID=1108764 RepID=A0ACC2J2R2_9PEZI|nr:hypothetical protein O1611_g10031 [Lasiodiplodia mahajangana]
MAKRKGFYGVRQGRKPGVYDNWEDCNAQVHRCKSVYRGFNTRDEAEFYVETGQTCDQTDGKALFDEWKRARQVAKQPQVKVEDFDASQSYFSQVPNFVPDDKADFDEEFGRFASSQNIQPGSKVWRQERTHAIRPKNSLLFNIDEVMFHYSQAEPDDKGSIKRENDLGLSKKQRKEQKQKFELQVLQNMCREVGLKPLSTIKGCRASIKGTLVNIVDYIDAKRNRSPIKVWPSDQFEAFRRYSLSGEKRIDLQTARSGDGFLEPLLQVLSRPNAAAIFEERRQRAGEAREGCAGRAPNNNVMNRKTEQHLEVVKEEPETPRRSLKLKPEPISVHGSESECSSPRSIKEERTAPWGSPSSLGSSIIRVLTQSEQGVKRGLDDSEDEDIPQGEISLISVHKRLRV